jgi:sulfide:quinone oxidoreductase
LPDPVVLVLGCGVSGVVAARTARQLLPANHRVIAIDREAQASYPPAFLRVMTGERRPEAMRRNRGRLARHGIEFVNAQVRQIDLDSHYVRAESREFHYDYLVIALGGGEPVTSGHSEVHTLETLEGAEHIAAALRYFSGGRILIAANQEGFRYPPRPYEMALLLEDYFHSRRVRQKVEISVYTPEAAPLEVLGPKNSGEFLSLLAHRGIEIQTLKCLAAVDNSRHVATMSDGEHANFQLLVTEPPFQLPAVLSELGLQDGSGRIPADPATFETAHENVFVIGDATYLTLLGGEPLPHAPGFAEKQAHTVAQNIAYRAGRAPKPDPFDAKARWLIETSNGAAMVAEGDFLAPQRSIRLKQPSLLWHAAALAQERYWFWHWY